MPVFPYTSPSAFSFVAVPSVTTARIICRTWSRAAWSGGSAGRSTWVGRSRISCGTTGAPRATVAATSAIPSGLDSTWPCPKPFSARCTRSGEAGTDPVTVVSAGIA